MSKDKRPIYCILGIIDIHNIIQHKPLWLMDFRDHCSFWGERTDKRWRFLISDWRLLDSELSRQVLTPAEREDVLMLIEKQYGHLHKNKI